MRKYIGNRRGTGDYKRLHDFLVKSGNEEYTYGRFDWMMTNWEYLEDQYLGRIGIWEDEGSIVGATMFDHSLDVIFPIVLEGYEYLYPEMIDYAQEHMVKEDKSGFRIYSGDHNQALVSSLGAKGFLATAEKEMVARIDFEESLLEGTLPEGYRITSLGQEENYKNYLHCLFRGFDHGENGEVFHYDDAREEEMKDAYAREYLDKNLKISIVDSRGNYVAHCGMWYDQNSEIALIEPVCVVPECRRLGLGRAVVTEGLRRVRTMGAKLAVVGSSQQFYYSIGMIPHKTGTLWKSAVRDQ